MNALQTRVYTLSTVERYACHALIGLLCMLFAAYLYFVGGMMLHAVSGQDAARASQDVASHIAALEMDYFALVDSLTLERAEALGLTSVSHKSFATRAARLGTSHGTGDEI
jgi:hypothetical protein